MKYFDRQLNIKRFKDSFNDKRFSKEEMDSLNEPFMFLCNHLCDLDIKSVHVEIPDTSLVEFHLDLGHEIELAVLKDINTMEDSFVEFILSYKNVERVSCVFEDINDLMMRMQIIQDDLREK